MRSLRMVVVYCLACGHRPLKTIRGLSLPRQRNPDPVPCFCEGIPNAGRECS
jgi:hypothetical protein